MRSDSRRDVKHQLYAPRGCFYVRSGAAIALGEVELDLAQLVALVQLEDPTRYVL